MTQAAKGRSEIIAGAARELTLAEAHIRKARDLLLPEGSPDLAGLAGQLAQIAESLSARISGCKDGVAPEDRASYRTLLPKLLVLAESIDKMSEDEYGNWVDALPFPEFIVYVQLAATKGALHAALAEARFTANRPDSQG